MFTRITGFFIVPLWLITMSWLVAHDVWPGLVADDPPTLKVTDWLRSHGREAQLSIYHASGQKLGNIWTKYLIDVASVRRDDWIWLETLPAGQPAIPLAITPFRVHVESVFTADGVLDEFTVWLDNADTRTKLHGERFHADFSFTLDGSVADSPLYATFKLPLTDGNILSGAFNPFSQLSDLDVGQTWRMQVFNPLAGFTGIGDRFSSMLVRVSGREMIATPNGERSCFVVEAPGAKAWVDELGVEWVQEMTLPLVGVMRIVREGSFDEDGYDRVRVTSLRR